MTRFSLIGFASVSGLLGSLTFVSGGALAEVPDYEAFNSGRANVGLVQNNPPDDNNLNFSVNVVVPLSGLANSFTDIGLTPSPSINSTASATTLSAGVDVEGSVNSFISYYFEILGPDGTVPLLVQAQGDLQFSDNSQTRMSGSALGSFLVAPMGTVDSVVSDIMFANFDDGALIDVELEGNTGFDGPTGLQLNEFGSYEFNTNTIYEVSLATLVSSSGSVTNRLDDNFLTTVDVDPIFSLLTTDPAYSLEFSAGVGNGNEPSQVPELPTWAMVIAGFGVVSYAGWRRSQRPESRDRQRLARST